MANTVVRLTSFQTRTLFELEDRAPGTYEIDLLIEGNSILSTLYVKSTSGGTVKANYYEETLGQAFAERKDLPSHPLQAAASTDPSKITVTPFHNKPKLEVIVAGGNVEFSIYITVVNSFASDLDAALQFDGETFVQATDKGLPAMCLDEDTGLLKFLRCKDGGLAVSPPAGIGVPFYSRGKITIVPGTSQSVLSFTVPAGTTRNLHRLTVVASNDANFSLESAGVEIAAGIIDITNRNITFVFDPPRPIGAGVFVELKYLSESEPGLGCDATGYISASDFT